MSQETFSSLEEAMMVLSDPSNPSWGAAFAFLSAHPETAAMMLENFSEVLEQMGVEPTGSDPATGAPAYSLEDVAKAIGVPEADLDAAPEPVPPKHE